MLDNLIKLTGAAWEEKYQKICGRRSLSMDADASRCASVVKGHAAAEGSSEKGTADTLARTDGPANELPETIRGGMEVTIRMASCSMKTWNWLYFHKTAEQQVRLHNTN